MGKARAPIHRYSSYPDRGPIEMEGAGFTGLRRLTAGTPPAPDRGPTESGGRRLQGPNRYSSCSRSGTDRETRAPVSTEVLDEEVAAAGDEDGDIDEGGAAGAGVSKLLSWLLASPACTSSKTSPRQVPRENWPGESSTKSPSEGAAAPEAGSGRSITAPLPTSQGQGTCKLCALPHRGHECHPLSQLSPGRAFVHP